MTASRHSTGCLVAAVLAALLASGCSTPSGPNPNRDYPGTLQAPTTFATEAVWQQRVTAKWQRPGQATEERGFDAALQRSGENLTVIGLSPMGSVGFSIQQSPAGIDVINNIPEQLVIPPQFILLDVQRTFFPWLAPAQAANSDQKPPLLDGTHTSQRDGEEITEIRRDGRLQQRTFRRLDNQPTGLISIRYSWQQPDWHVPTEAVLVNGWFGYQLTIVTHSETRLQASSDNAPEVAR